jgi:hypothetical protein
MYGQSKAKQSKAKQSKAKPKKTEILNGRHHLADRDIDGHIRIKIVIYKLVNDVK